MSEFDKKISQLTGGSASQATDEYVINRGGANYKITGANVAAAATAVGTLAGLTMTGNLTLDTDVVVSRGAANRLDLASGDSLNLVSGSYQIAGASVLSGTTLGSGVTASSLTSVGTLSSLTVSGDLTVDTSTLKVDSANNRVGIGTASPGVPLHVVGKLGVNFASAIAGHIAAESGSQYALQLSTNDFVNSTTGTRLLFGFGASSGNTTVNLLANYNGGLTPADVVLSIGNLGLGVTPSAWGSTFKPIQLGQSTYISGRTNANALYVGTNGYWDGSADKYIVNGFASSYEQGSGVHTWKTAASGTAGGTISYTTAMTLDASGNLGVGTASPAARLEVYLGASNGTYFLGGSGDPARQLKFSTSTTTNAGDTHTIDAQSGTGILRFATTSTERARITAGGYFKASDAGTYAGSTAAYHEFLSSADNRIVRAQNTHNSSPFGFLIEYTAASPNGTSNEFVRCTDNAGGGTERASIRSNGGLANYSANNVNLASDERLKKDIAPLASTWDKLKAMEVVNFRYKDCNDGDPALYGVIAQQVQPIVPELVVVTREAVEAKDAVLDEDGNEVTPAVEASPEYYGIREQPMYWLAIKALQEAQARIEALEARLEALEA